MRQTISGLIISTVILMSHAAKADVMLEPYLGYGISSFTVTTPGGNFTGASNGPGIGARIGYSFMPLFAAVDLNYNLIKFKPDNATLTSGNGGETLVSAVVGADLIVLRAWAGYIFSGSYDTQDGSSDKFTNGSGFKLGVGYKLIPLVSLNIEYNSISYTGFTTSSAVTSALVSAGGVSKFARNLFLISVSVPL